MNDIRPTLITDEVIKGLEDEENYIIKLKTSNLLKYIPGDVIKASNKEIECVYLSLASVDEKEVKKRFKEKFESESRRKTMFLYPNEIEEIFKWFQPYLSQSEGKKGEEKVKNIVQKAFNFHSLNNI